MQLKKYLIATLFSLGMVGSACASSLVATTDTLLGAVAASAEALSDTTSSLLDSKVVHAARDDAASFVASAGTIRGARLEATLAHIRSHAAEFADTGDMQLAQAILSR